jgi:hypothetical protein
MRAICHDAPPLRVTSMDEWPFEFDPTATHCVALTQSRRPPTWLFGSVAVVRHRDPPSEVLTTSKYVLARHTVGEPQDVPITIGRSHGAVGPSTMRTHLRPPSVVRTSSPLLSATSLNPGLYDQCWVMYPPAMQSPAHDAEIDPSGDGRSRAHADRASRSVGVKLEVDERRSVPAIEEFATKATPATVWAILMDVETWPAWTTTMTSLTRLEPGALHVGSRVRIRQPGMLVRVWTVTELDNECSFTWTVRIPGALLTARHVLSESRGSTVVRLAAEVSGPLSTLWWSLAGRLARRFVATEARGLERRVSAA